MYLYVIEERSNGYLKKEGIRSANETIGTWRCVRKWKTANKDIGKCLFTGEESLLVIQA